MQSSSRWRFGPFEADACEHRLLRDGLAVPVTRKAFALLATLLSRPGKLFTKAELFDTVWAGSVVTDAALSRAIHELRVALGDDAAAPRYIATAHGLGFRFVALVSLDLPQPSLVAQVALADQRLVGRDPAFAFLGAALTDARAGQRQVVFVTGEAGIGKTALVEAFIGRHSGSADLRAAQGRCIEQYGTGEAYLPILEALENLAGQVGSDAFRDVLARYAPAWLAQLPWLAHDADPALLQCALTDTTAQRMLREIAQALEVLCADQPIVLWLEDLHWSDPSSLAVVSFLAGRRDPARLLVVASFRRADAQASDSPLHGLVLQLLQRGQASELALGPLDQPAIASYLQLRFEPSVGLPCDALGAFVHRRTDGNALFTVAIVDDLVRQGVLQQEAGTWTMKTRVSELGNGLPDDLRHLVHDQIERLGASDRQLIEAAADVGTDFSAAALAAALQAEIGDSEERCVRLAQKGRFRCQRPPVTWPDGTIACGFGFLHALYWQGAHERVMPGRRADLQRRIGLRQEQAYGSQCNAIAAELAMRFEAARDMDRSLRYLQLAGTGALVRCAYLESIKHFRHALGLLPSAPPGQQPRLELDLLLPLGAALMAVQGYASDDVEATYQRALALCRVCARPGELERVLRGLWNVVFLRADLVRAQQAAEELLGHAQASCNPSLPFDAFTKLGQTSMHRGDMASARQHLEHALSLASPVGDSTRLREAPRATAYLAWVLWYTGFPAQAMARADEALELARRAASPHSKAFALGFVSWLHVFRGDMAPAVDLARQQRVLSVEHGLVYWRIWADFTLGMAQARQGASLGGTTTMRDAIDEMRSTGAEVGIVHFLCLLADAELAVGQPDEAHKVLSNAEALLAHNGNEQHAAEIERLRGRLALTEGPGIEPIGRAELRFESALSIARQQGARALELRAATDLAALWGRRGDGTRAVQLLAPIHAAFSEGCDTLDLVLARELLATLVP